MHLILPVALHGHQKWARILHAARTLSLRYLRCSDRIPRARSEQVQPDLNGSVMKARTEGERHCANSLLKMNYTHTREPTIGYEWHGSMFN